MNTSFTKFGKKPHSVWAECQGVGSIARFMEQAQPGADIIGALAAHLGWSLSKTARRLNVQRAIPPMVLHLAGVRDEQMDMLPLARLIDIARKHTLRDKAISLSYAVYGRWPKSVA